MSHSSRITPLSHRLIVLACIALLAISLTPFSAFSDDKQEPPWGPPTDLDTSKCVVQDDATISSSIALAPDDAGSTSVPVDNTDDPLLLQILTNLIWVL